MAPIQKHHGNHSGDLGSLEQVISGSPSTRLDETKWPAMHHLAFTYNDSIKTSEPKASSVLSCRLNYHNYMYAVNFYLASRRTKKHLPEILPTTFFFTEYGTRIFPGRQHPRC
jgi:hypothetical protein